MGKVRLIIHCALRNIRKWRGDLRIYLLLAVSAAFVYWTFAGVREIAAQTGTGVTPWVFSFFLSMPAMQALYGCVITLLFCNAPFSDGGTPFLAVRTGRRCWIEGQLCYIALASLIAVISLFLLTLIELLPYVELSGDWGSLMRLIGSTPDPAGRYGVEMAVDVYTQFLSCRSAVEGFLLTGLMMWLVAMFLGTVIAFFNVLTGKNVGIVVSAVLSFLAYLSAYVGNLLFGNGVFYLSPVSWCSLYNLSSPGIANYGVPTVGCAVSVLVIGSLLLSVGTVLLTGKRDFSITKEAL